MRKTRRDVILTTAGAMAVGGLAGCVAGGPRRAGEGSGLAPEAGPGSMDSSGQLPRGDGRTPGPANSRRAILADAPPADLPRVREWMERDGVDALVVSHPVNVYYLTGFWPATSRMGYEEAVTAILPRDERYPVAIVTGEFTWYYLMSDAGYRFPLEVFLYGAPPDPQRSASEWQGGEKEDSRSRIFPDARLAPVSDRDRRRAQDVQRAVQAHSLALDREQALARALSWTGLRGGRIAADSDVARPWSERTGANVSFVEADRLLKRSRMVKSVRELALARAAAAANVEAALASVAAVRAGATLVEFRRTFFAEAARRGNRGVFMVVDGVSDDDGSDVLRDGQAFMFDAVSEAAGYHGDFSRTVFLGEPPRAAKPVVAAVQRGWSAIREMLGPGRRFSEITSTGRSATGAAGLDLLVMFGPHSVGLHHNDAIGLGDLVLEPGMVVSIDCPVLSSGVGGTFHFEDLMVITRSGAEPLHPVAPASLVA